MQLLNQLLNVFISNAYADTPSAPAQSGSSYSMLMMVIIFVAFMYFGMWRPQSKRMREQRDLLNSLSKDDEVMTAGGILGTINKVSDKYVVLALGNNVEITVQKSSVVSALPKGTIKSIQ